MKEIHTPEYTALVSTPGPILRADHPGYNPKSIRFTGNTYFSSLYGYFITRQPFIHVDKGLIMCSNISIKDETSGIYVASHLPIGCVEEEIDTLRTDLGRLDEILSEFGSRIEQRELGLVFGNSKDHSQHKNIYDLLVNLGYCPNWVYQSRHEDEEIYINHITKSKNVSLNGDTLVIPDEVDQKALRNGPIIPTSMLNLLKRS